ncbi:MAG: hypothetical protein ACLVC1_10830 [Mediterraneibacter gnavus]
MTNDRIEKAIRQNNVRLMIMDPIRAYLGANVDMNRANEIRPLFRQSQYDIAETYWMRHCAPVGHLNKVVWKCRAITVPWDPLISQRQYEASYL